VLGLQPRKKRAGLPLPALAAGLILFLPGYRLLSGCSGIRRYSVDYIFAFQKEKESQRRRLFAADLALDRLKAVY
jgi:hypothetical protein